MSDIVDRTNDYLVLGGLFNPENANHMAVRDLIIDCRDEIKRLQRYERMVNFIANDYHELSHDKAYWQRDDWKSRCRRLIEEDHNETNS